MISVITNSCVEEKFKQMEGVYNQALQGEQFEIIRIPDAKSMCEGYNRAIPQAHGDVLVFTHDDAGPLRPGFGSRLRRHLQSYDIVGGAGTNRLVSAVWFQAGPPHVFGQVLNFMVQQSPGASFVFDPVSQIITVDNIEHDALKIAGMQKGDVITGIADVNINVPQDMQGALAKIKDGKVTWRIKREGEGTKKLYVDYGEKGLPAHPMYNLSVFGVPAPAVGSIQAIDGFFMAARREVVLGGDLRPASGQSRGVTWFDEEMCEGFHLYDIDFSFRAYRNGLKVGVANDLFLAHASAGGYGDPKWKVASDKWMAKYKHLLPEHKQRQYNLTTCFFNNIPEGLWMQQELVEQTRRD